jgi:hypothetical protein
MQNKIIGAAIAIAAVLAAFDLGRSRASADDSRLTVIPAVERVTDSANSGANVQFVQWGRPYGYRYRASYGPYYSRGYYAPNYGYQAYGGYGYSYPAYNYGYGYPAYGYGYSYPAYGYPAYGGIGIRAGGVGVGIW